MRPSAPARGPAADAGLSTQGLPDTRSTLRFLLLVFALSAPVLAGGRHDRPAHPARALRQRADDLLPHGRRMDPRSPRAGACRCDRTAGTIARLSAHPGPALVPADLAADGLCQLGGVRLDALDGDAAARTTDPAARGIPEVGGVFCRRPRRRTGLVGLPHRADAAAPERAADRHVAGSRGGPFGIWFHCS